MSGEPQKQPQVTQVTQVSKMMNFKKRKVNFT